MHAGIAGMGWLWDERYSLGQLALTNFLIPSSFIKCLLNFHHVPDGLEARSKEMNKP
jgi:hypothetical protein